MSSLMPWKLATLSDLNPFATNTARSITSGWNTVVPQSAERRELGVLVVEDHE